MKNIKSTIRDHIVQPGIREAKKYETVARVIRTDEKNNTCAIKYRGRDGDYHHVGSAYVKIDPDGCGWFPKAKDIVVVEEQRGTVTIKEPFDPNYQTETRRRRRLKEDVHADETSNSLAGSIF